MAYAATGGADRPKKLTTAVKVALWVKGDLPVEYTTYVLCKEFGYLPSEVEAEDTEDIMALLACMTATSEIEQAKANKSQRRI